MCSAVFSSRSFVGVVMCIAKTGAVLGANIFLLLLTIITVICDTGYRKPLVRYPKDTQFWATDFFVKGCKNFIDKCPKSYKYQHICARSYDGDYKDFQNYCFMQYENCNTWRNWHVFKREKC